MKKFLGLFLIGSLAFATGPILNKASDIKYLTDSMSKQLDILEVAIGNENLTGTMLRGAALNVDTIMSFTKTPPVIALLPCYVSLKTNLGVLGLASFLYRPAVQELCGYLNPISTWWADSLPNDRMAPWFADIARWIGTSITPTLVFPHITNMALFAITGLTTGNYVDSLEINETLYGAADLEVYLVTISDSAVGITVTGKDQGGDTTATWTATTGKGAAAGTIYALTPGEAGDRCFDTRSISITNGCANDTFLIRSKYDRTLNL